MFENMDIQLIKSIVLLLCKGILFSISIAFLIYFITQPNYYSVLTSIGLILDLSGVIYVVYELFPFTGQRTNGVMYESAKKDSEEYAKFKEHHLKIGLFLIISGFFCQLFANWQSLITTVVNILK